MSYTVIYNIPDTDDTHFIGEYNIPEPNLYIPKFLLLKMADYSNLQTKGKLDVSDMMNDLNYLIQGFKSIGFINPLLEIKDIRDYVDRYLLNTSENDMINLYDKMISPNEDGYTAFTVLEKID